MLTFLQTAVQDIRYALRQLRRAPGFTLSVMLVLGLGIGANAAIFSILNVTLLQRLPFAKPAQLVTLEAVDAKGAPALAMLPDTLDWQKQSHTLTDLAYYNYDNKYLETPAGDQRVSATAISPNLLATLGVVPALGRGFTAQEQQPGHDNVVLLSDAIWRNLYHADPAILGKAVSIEGVPSIVVGVMPAHFAFPLSDTLPQLWRPLTLNPGILTRDMNSESVEAIARIKPGTTPAAVQADLSSIQARLKPLYANPGIASLIASAVQAKPYRATLNASERPALLALLAAIGVIWLIACANAANLMLTRGAARRRELAVRGALGASRARIVRQLLTESLLLAAGSAVVGLLLGAATLRLFAHALLKQLNLTQPPAFDLTVLAALLVLTLISTLLVGLVPALLATNTPIEQALRQDGAQAGTGRSRNRLQRSLVVVEIALSLSLLVACGLLLRTVFALHQVPLGFRTDHIVLVKPSVPAYKHKETGLTQSVYLPLLDRVRTMHGVQAAALTTVVPLDRSFQRAMQMSMWKDDKPGESGRIDLQIRASTTDLKNVFGFRVIEGRYFNAQDTPESAPVLVVNEAFARAYKSILGKSIIGDFAFGSSGGRPAKAIGVVEDFRQVGVDKPAAPEIDMLASQLPLAESKNLGLDSHIQLVIRTSEPVAVFLPDLRRVLADASPDLRTAAITTMDHVVEDSLGPQALAAHLLEALGGLALFVALAGLYSLLAYMVALRTQELGIRIALGADRVHIVGLVLSQAAVLVVVGIAAGTAISLAAAHLIEHFLFGVRPHDTATLAASAALMLAVSLLAAWLPARRAAAIDPMQALRTE